MVAAFCFLGGDFSASVELVATVVNALGQNSEASGEYRELVRQLRSLETALLRVKRLHIGDSQHSELVGLRQAATGCHQTINDFCQKIQKYQPHLQANGSSSRLKDSWMKIKWAVCEKDDVAKFKADLVGHTESIQMLLATVQIEGANIAKDSQELHNNTLAIKLQAGYSDCLQRISSSIGQGKQLLRIAAKILRTNLQIFRVVVAIQTMVANMPRQIDRQQPVYLIDALGKHTPFHLEFVRSAEGRTYALIAVLKVNFKTLGEQAVSKIETGMFVIQDSATKRDIDLGANWETCCYAGQHAEMSIIFTDWRKRLHTVCPKCEKECGFSLNNDIECLACGTKFRRIEDAKLSIADLEAEISLLSIGPAGPKQRSSRLLDLIQRVRINTPPLKPLEVEPTSSTISVQSSQSTARNISASLDSRQEETTSPHPRSFFNRTFSHSLWACCVCGHSAMTVIVLSCCDCGSTRCEHCYVYPAMN